MSNTTTTSTTTINPNSPSYFTVAIDANNNITWCSESMGFSAGDLLSGAKGQAKTFVIGNNVKHLGAAFASHENVRNIFVYSNEIKDSVYASFKTIHQYNENTGVITNSAGEVVTVSVLNNENYIFDLYKANRDRTKPIHPSDFGAIEYDTGAINLAILYVTTYGGKLMFEKEGNYRITGPIRICQVNNSQSNTGYRNFEIDFNYSKITVSIPHLYSGFDATDEKKNTMIYVNTGFVNDERIGIIRNVELDTGTKNRIHTGIYFDAAPQVSFKNIVIKDVTRGIYISPHSYEVFMDNITISKSLNGNGELVFEDYPNNQDDDNFNAESYFPNCNYVGLDCYASDNHFSKITVEDYFIGVRLIGGDNRIKDAVVKNEHSSNQRKYSVGFINGSSNYYIDCEVNDSECSTKGFYIGWMSYYAVPFFLTNCKWYGSDISEKAYAFYIAHKDYSGGGIYTRDCSIIGLVSDTQEKGLVFCNVTNNDINYLGTTENIETKDN